MQQSFKIKIKIIRKKKLFGISHIFQPLFEGDDVLSFLHSFLFLFYKIMRVIMRILFDNKLQTFKH